MKLSSQLKYLRKEKKLTQKELANATGLSFHAINSYESGRREPNSKAMSILEDFFKVSGSFLRGEDVDLNEDFSWEDAELMSDVISSFPNLFNSLSIAIKSCSMQEQKMLFDILIEILHIAKLDDESENKRLDAISFLHDVISRLNIIV